MGVRVLLSGKGEKQNKELRTGNHRGRNYWVSKRGTEREAECWFPEGLLVRLTDCSGLSLRSGSFRRS